MKETLLIGIGAQKAGTTWLAEYLRDRQSDVHLPEVKEVHFFDNYCIPNYGSYFEDQRLEKFKSTINKLSKSEIGDPSINSNLLAQLKRFSSIYSPEKYLDFLNFGREAQSVLCDITPDYALLDPADFKLMKSVHENVKLVFILRNPADRFWSSLRFNHTHNPGFDIESNFQPMLGRQDFVRFANYDRTIRAIYESFNAEHLHIEFYENLFSDMAIKRFCTWLGLEFVAADYSTQSNAAVKSEMPVERRRQAVIAYQQTYHEIAARFDDEIPENWKNDIKAYL